MAVGASLYIQNCLSQGCTWILCSLKFVQLGQPSLFKKKKKLQMATLIKKGPVSLICNKFIVYLHVLFLSYSAFPSPVVLVFPPVSALVVRKMVPKQVQTPVNLTAQGL